MQYLLCPISFCFPSLNSIISPVKMLQLGLCKIRYSEDLQTLCDSASLTPRNQDLSKNSFSTSVQLCLTLYNPVDCSTPGLPVHHQLPELAQTHVLSATHWIGFSGGWVVKNLPASAGDMGRSFGEGNGNPSSVLAWEIPWTKKPGGQWSLGLQRVRHHWMTKTVTTHGILHFWHQMCGLYPTQISFPMSAECPSI